MLEKNEIILTKTETLPSGTGNKNVLVVGNAGTGKDTSTEADILDIVSIIMDIPHGTGEFSKDEFWIKCDESLLIAYISLMVCLYTRTEQSIECLIGMVKNSLSNEGDADSKRCIDLDFEFLEKWITGSIKDTDTMFGNLAKSEPTEEQKRIGKFALDHYQIIKSLSNKVMISVLLSCMKRLDCLSSDSGEFVFTGRNEAEQALNKLKQGDT